MDARVVELHCIMPIGNLQSVLKHGLLSYERAAELQHHSIAMQPVQDKRDQKNVPGGLTLHKYANMYFHARNPMMYKRLGEMNELAVLRVSTDVLNIGGAVVSDQNAASDYARFYGPSQIGLLDFDMIYAESWKDDDKIQYWRKKSRKCAEVLVPHGVPVNHIFGAYVVSAQVAQAVAALGVGLPVSVNSHLFFR